jgi:checkpoint serine/threonine-protein kinase
VKRNEDFPYWFVIYLTLEMLYIVQYLHKCKIIHADIKADNLLINQLPVSIDYFEPNKTKCLVLIDFNRSIDLTMLPNEAEFDAKASNKSLFCCEMNSNKTWTYQIDFYGILSCIHCIIFKKYMNVFNENERNKIAASFPRKYDKIFSKLFDTYLNIPDCQHIPDLESDWIQSYVALFKNELGNSFCKSSGYLKELSKSYLRK